jgi:hypothetical protein
MGSWLWKGVHMTLGGGCEGDVALEGGEEAATVAG